MVFPSIGEIAVQHPVSIVGSASIAEAMQRMVEKGLRDIVVVDSNNKTFSLFTANDLIYLNTHGLDLAQPLTEYPCRALPCFPLTTNILEVFGQLCDDDDYLGVVTDNNELMGIVSYSDLISSIDPEIIIERQELYDLFRLREIHTTSAQTPISSVLCQLELIDDCIIVVATDLPVGIITTKDAVRIIAKQLPQEMSVSEVMTQPLQTVPHTATIREALEFINKNHFKRIVVTEGNQLLGVVRQRELVNLAYSRWAEMLRNHAAELQEVVMLLERQTVKLEHLATTDPLTGIANRQKFEKRIRQELYRVNRYGKERLSLILIDLDHFKQVNDNYGHPVGDRVLKEVVELLKQGLRTTDLLGRWGGGGIYSDVTAYWFRTCRLYR
ncbi:GGDEF domain-containing protein [Candidatus Venteria ishoeyi]|uniref:diguanylate cyclase n=1 Tax=Candidatus Venteria ishoeyi TaxID=1899563 RepID=A0A1H6FC10_9GAMM|nr:GGDEF domain-containing protein [Candidatus Venteria ishoeyi]SEH07630.1 Phytochrome-like protein cph2 [Candidatus Venteria ishoeyi]